MMEDETHSQFENLYKSLKLADCERRYIIDGVIDPELFERQGKKVLLIAKEHNYVTEVIDPNYAADYRKWWKQHVHLQFSHRISEWAYGILHGFSDKVEELTYQQKHEALRSIAFINVKKSSGGANSSAPVITSYINNSRQLLVRQINEISPSIIICCFRYDNYPNELFQIQMERHSSGSFSRGIWETKPIINFFHPSSRKSKASLYALMYEALEFSMQGFLTNN